MRMSLRNHFVADNVKHGSSRKGKGKGQDHGKDTAGKIADKRAHHLNKTGQKRNAQGSARLDARSQHRADDHHALVREHEVDRIQSGAGVFLSHPFDKIKDFLATSDEKLHRAAFFLAGD